MIGRIAALAAVAIAVVAVIFIVTSGGSDYKLTAVFENASQLVPGDTVQVAGNAIGTVSDITLTPQGQAKLALDIVDPTYRPLHEGTIATVRAASLSGIANRYVDLRLGSGSAPQIGNGGEIPSSSTNSAVDLDQLFNTLDQPTRKGLQDFIQGSNSQYAGQGRAAAMGFKYLNPVIASSSVLFREINRDTGKFTAFITNTAHLVNDISGRASDLSGLVSHLSQTTSALASRTAPLGQSIDRLPNFMRSANTTFVNLRSALDVLTPLVNDSKPVAPKLRTLLAQLKPLAEEAVPTVRDLSRIISRPGANNDLTELTRLGVPLAGATVRSLTVNGKRRPGAFAQSVSSLMQSTPELAFARPYAVDLTGWFDGFSHPGVVDANGSASRVAPVVGAFSLLQSGTINLVAPVQRALSALGIGGAGIQQGQKSQGALVSGQGDRCPGSMERGGLIYPESGYACDPNQIPTGP